jgi:F0F1-type ATP synthase membrane subunit c/vacuolar-type H+-ATPase subunit K
MYYLTYITMAAANNIGAGLAAIGLTGAGIGIGSIFSSLISSTARNPALRGQLLSMNVTQTRLLGRILRKGSSCDLLVSEAA